MIELKKSIKDIVAGEKYYLVCDLTIRDSSEKWCNHAFKFVDGWFDIDSVTKQICQSAGADSAVIVSFQEISKIEFETWRESRKGK